MENLFNKKIYKQREDVSGYGCWGLCSDTCLCLCGMYCTTTCQLSCRDTCVDINSDTYRYLPPSK